MKKILLMSSVIPDGNGIGVQRRIANYLKALCKHFEVHLLVCKPFYKGNPIPESLAALCESAVLMPVDVKKSSFPTWFPPMSYIAEWLHPSYKRNMPDEKQLKEIAKLFAAHQFDTVFCFRIRTSIILDRLEEANMVKKSYKKIVDFDDIESVAIARELETKGGEAGLEYRLIQALRIRRLEQLEARFLQSYDIVLSCSDKDTLWLEQQKPKARILSAPNCVVLPETVAHGEEGAEVVNILFVGTMSYLPNEDGIIWFVKNIYPQLVKRSSKPISLTLVGYNPAQKVRDLARFEGVTVTGGVESVVPYYENCHFVISPIRFGGGTRIKILEALSQEKAVVSTTVGAEGIEVEHAKSILLADSEEDFVKACLTLIDSPSQRLALGKAGRELVANHYTVDAIGEKIKAII
ncbi:glycosyltransferase family 4 protein [Aliiglaciecola sp. CAU 1673]|uniref:glycosyltransferase family 4 protein n=1 Tax=Aliiglaciecola sp. CAU 1673 TaxID=3032595 RepID=UPI0023DC89AB|nr:glycosyltransferase family 4 protein [Aliiglaciecola sp. CAU 1673]MDF2177296.1 glycosyltransferase family 4 protein [Aliiglaciecola sp. CAU 1673]